MAFPQILQNLVPMETKKNDKINFEISAKHSSIAVHRMQKDLALMSSVLDSVDEAVVLVDSLGNIKYINRAGREFTGTQNSPTEKTSLWKLLPELGKAVANLGVPAKNTMFDVELFYPEHRWARVQISEFSKDDSATNRLCSLVLRDITEERDSTNERIESERINSIVGLAAGVAHEIGNPLNSLQIHLGLMKKRLAKLAKSVPALAEQKKLPESVDICIGEIARLDCILKDFLGAIRNKKPTLVPVDLPKIVVEVLHVMEQDFQNHRIHCNIEVSPLLPTILGDETQLKQLFFNVFKNALEAMTDGGKLDIALAFDDDDVLVRVADTGCGISKDDLAKIYEPFYTTKSGGHGLGMMIVERILKSHNARILVSSTLGTGTVFTFKFPRPDRRAKTLAGTQI